MRTAISLAALGWLATSAHAQSHLRPLPATGDTPRSMSFQKNAAPAQKGPVRPASYQEPQPEGISLPPSVLDAVRRAEKGDVDPKELFSMRSEATIRKEIVAESGAESIYGKFPTDYAPLSTVAYAGRTFPPHLKLVEPMFVCHRRLYFEQKNSERQGWELGPLQPIFSTAFFVKDFFVLPYNFATRPCDRWECSAGKCLPGDPTPFLLYPVEFSVTGALFQAGTVVGLAAIIP